MREDRPGRLVYDGPRFVYTLGMSEQSHPILIGCSGWSYPDWEGAFYPEGMRAGEYLEYYADRFPIVEVDSTFYRVPTPSMVRGWRDRTPEDFQFAPKVAGRIPTFAKTGATPACISLLITSDTTSVPHAW